ncbi:hypothetical protein IFM47457_02767 [Aspergillus lentulus]|nr:hypothetical protein IFM47457_02767 [Aspergillus lentulus]
MVRDEQIIEVSYNGEGFQGSTVMKDRNPYVKPHKVSVAYQKEVDTPNGHMPETVTVAYRQSEGTTSTTKTCIWTNTTGAWKRGPDIDTFLKYLSLHLPGFFLSCPLTKHYP